MASKRELHNFGDRGIPFHSVLETRDGVDRVIAYPKGGTFSESGLRMVQSGRVRYVAFIEDAEDDDGVEVSAIDEAAARMVIDDLVVPGTVYGLLVCPEAVYLGLYTAA